MSEERKSGGKIFKLVAEFFTAKCECTLSNGFYNWACVAGKYKQCSKMKHKFSCVALGPVITYFQFEQKERQIGYHCWKKSKKTERVHHSISFKKTVAKLIAIKSKYLTHRYQVLNGSYHSLQILNPIGALRPKYHMEYSGNITQSFKCELQESHFNKKNNTALYCKTWRGQKQVIVQLFWWAYPQFCFHIQCSWTFNLS